MFLMVTGTNDETEFSVTLMVILNHSSVELSAKMTGTQTVLFLFPDNLKFITKKDSN